LASLAVHPCQGETGGWLNTVKELHPYAAVTGTNDSNLFRRPKGPLEQSDNYLTAEAGFDTELSLGRQRFLLDGRVFRNYYETFDRFDYTGGEAEATWQWLAGRLWSGEVGYTFNRQLRDFANELVPTRDIQNRNKVYASANRWLDTRWRVGAEVDWVDITFSESDFLDKTRYDVRANLDYVTNTDNSVGVDVVYSPSYYSNRNGLDYDDVIAGANARWRLTDKTRLRATAGYQVRSYDSADERNFDGLVGSVRAIWDVTGKTTVEAAAWQELSNLGDQVPNYAIVDGISLEPKWQITAKTALRGIASYERRDFERIPEEELGVVLPDRVDDVSALGMWLDWAPRPNIW
jgi:hypothetical protein